MAGLSVNDHRWQVAGLPFREVGPSDCRVFILLNKGIQACD